MKYAKQDKLALFAANTQAIKKYFTWHDAITKRLAALLYTLENKAMDCDAVRDCHNLIKSNTNAFSPFRGNMSLCIAAMLSLCENREEQLANTLSAYNLLKSEKFHTSDYLAVAAYQIAANAPQERHQQVVESARAFYDGMKAKHWFHTGQDDYIYAAMLGLSGLDANAGAERIEELYGMLQPKFRSGNSVQALSQILVLGGKDDDAVQHIFSLCDTLKRNKIRLDKTYTLPVLGTLALLPVEGDIIAQDILEAQAFLRAQKGFGAFSVTSQELLLYTAAIISSGYAENMADSLTTASLSTSIASIIIAQQAAMIAIIASSAAVSSSSQS